MSRFPFPIPHGWFGLCWSHELQQGDVKKVRFCNRDLVVFRTESGQAAALDNYCPHLGAPLHQGAVVGETVRCPFHHWQWGTDGECKDIPYAKKIPEKAVTEAIPIVEKNGMVMGWHHPEGKPPYFDVQDIPALSGSDEWGEVHYYEYDLPTCVQEIAENDVDGPHFTYLHGMPAFHETDSEVNGPLKKSVSVMQTNPDFLQGEASSDSQYALYRESYGPGSVTVLSKGVQGVDPGIVGQFLLWNVSTPINDDRTLLRWSMCLTKNLENDDMGKTLIEGYPEGVKDDIPIWEEKVYREKPVLCDGDGPIAKNRKWFEQFYS